jgi:hypothetical protein
MDQIEELKTYRINEVEVFSAGEWNRDKYGVNDLHDMVTAFNNLKDGFKPFLKLGHDDNQKLVKSSGLPSVGWVEKLYVKGSKLYADLDYIPEKIFKLIKSKAYRKVSCEIYWDLDVDGTKYPRVLGAVALLGAETPGVMNLSDILGKYANKSKADVVFKAFEKDDTFKTYEVNFQTSEGDEMSEEMEGLKAELEAQKKDYASIEAAKSDLQKQLDAQQAELSALREANAKALADANAAKVAKFVTELESKKLVTPAMKDLVSNLMSDKKEYSIGEKTLTKEEAIEQILTLSTEAAKVNFTESSRADFGKKEDKMKDLEDKIEKYAQDNKCSYAQAYKAVMKDQKQTVEE